jgi:DNA-binding transcriptional ArsR family regulator
MGSRPASKGPPRIVAQAARRPRADSTSLDDHGAFEALGDSHRRHILRLLGAGEKSVQEIASELPISRPAVSRHLKLLGEAGLVSSDRRGTRQIYQLRDEGMRAVQLYLERVWGEAASRFRLLAENTERDSDT